MIGWTIRRSDNLGSGGYGASRNNGTRKHWGLDIEVPATGVPLYLREGAYSLPLVRLVDPYSDRKDNALGGMMFDVRRYVEGATEDDFNLLKILYIQPILTPEDAGSEGHLAIPGRQFAWTQPERLVQLYPGITPHIHVEQRKDIWGPATEFNTVDPSELLNKLFGYERP